jgi:hypothetical protein
MTELTFGEVFVIAFIVSTILTARFWPVLGERIALLLGGEGPKK